MICKDSRAIELLAPARDAATGIEAVKHGADAVYIGPPHNGARAAAANSIDDLRRLCDFAHQYDARIYATVNTVIYDSELRQVEAMIRDLYRAGVDALIVQDMAVLRLDIPPIDLHASTQCDIRTPERARWLAECGFSQLVLPREMTLAETEAVRQAVPREVVLEAFVHGALCVSYSGDCQASCATTGRSANRGECAQICRLAYDLTDAEGRVLMADRHFLSLRDLNRSRVLAELIAAGVGSLKIEGRLKDAGYVKNVTARYRQLLDQIIDQSEGRYRRASAGRVTLNFTPDLQKSFNRGYTEYFTHEARPEGQMASIATPKWRGEEVGRVRRVNGRTITAALTTTLANGDGLTAENPGGGICGFRLNRAEGNQLTAASDIRDIRPGATLYRNRDKERDELLGRESATRRVDIAMTLRTDAAGRAIAELRDGRGCAVTVAAPGDERPEPARTDQTEAHRRALTKMGDTIYTVGEFTDLIPGLFIPLSRLSSLRRLATDALSRARELTRPVRLRLPYARRPIAPLPSPGALTYHDNVANRLARELYTAAGATAIEPALETMTSAERRERATTVMTTRYCLRRELGCCLREGASAPNPHHLPKGPLHLRAEGNMQFRLDFDCRECRMRVVKEQK